MADTSNPSSGCYSPYPDSDLKCLAPSNWANCRPWSLETDAVNCYASSIVDEGLNIGGVTIHVYKLLGIHEQQKLTDKTGNGRGISSGDQQLFPVSNAFDKKRSEWRSFQVGQQLITSGYIGYDFGEVKLANGRVRYGIEANVRYNIASMKIKQGSKPQNRVTKARIERSDDGKSWYGVEVVTLPDNDKLNTITFKSTVPSRFWRIRPLSFAGEACDWWVVQALELSDREVTRLDNIQDKIWLENRSRDYDTNFVKLKAYYTPTLTAMDLTRFYMEPDDQRWILKMSFTQCVTILGRPIVVGDIIEMPNEAMYTPSLERQNLFLQVDSVTWDTDGTVTPGWQYTMLSISASPAAASEETQDIFGDLKAEIDESGLSNINDGNNEKYQDYMDISQTIKADSNSEVHERGIDGSGTLRFFTEEDVALAKERNMPNIQKTGLRPKQLYVEDAMPPNGAPYTEGPELPPTAANKAYHRLTYEGSAKDIPPRLYQYSTIKGKWIYLETDRRFEINNQKQLLDEYLSAPNKIPARKVK